jgi:hypothetical protein
MKKLQSLEHSIIYHKIYIKLFTSKPTLGIYAYSLFSHFEA